MTTQSSPIITEMKVIPVAGHDSMLLNIGGAHNAWFTRNIVVLTDNAGHTGVGEAPGGEVIYQTLLAAIPQVVGRGRLTQSRGSRCTKAIRRRISTPSAKGRGPSN